MNTVSTAFEYPFTDAEVRAFIDAAPSEWDYPELASRCAARFGPDRAWQESRIKAYVLSWKRLLYGNRFKIMRDPEVHAYVDGRIGLVSYDALVAECRARFGQTRAPSRSSLSRYASYLRAVYARAGVLKVASQG